MTTANSSLSTVHTEETVAEQLYAAYDTKEAITPPRETITDLDLAGAYRIQQLQKKAFEADGHQVIGHKIGLTSLAMQQQLGVDSPDFGFFTDRMRFHAGEEVAAGAFIAPKVEPELAFTLATDLPADPTLEQVRDAVESVHLAVEIIDSRVANWDIRLVDTVADNASCGAIVMSDQPVEINFDELPRVQATMSINGSEVGSGIGAAVMDHPLIPLQWLARTLGEQGVPLKAGEIILTGSFCGAVAFAAGDVLDVDYGRYGNLSLTFN